MIRSRLSSCRPRAPSSIKPCCSSRRTPRSICSTATPTTGYSCMSSACSSWAIATSSCRNILRFIKGVVDAQDMSLNVSREMLQQDRQVKAIRRRLTKKVLSTIKDLQSERPQDYRAFWTQFGRVLKEGLISDFDNRDTVLRISSFASTHSDEEPTT